MQKTRTLLAAVCFLSLMLAVSACAGFGDSASTSSTPTRTATTSSTSSTGSNTSSSSGSTTSTTPGLIASAVASQTKLQTFNTTTFSIGYPIGWKESNGSDNRNYSFMRPDGVTGLYVGVNNSDVSPTDTLSHFAGSMLTCTPDNTTQTASFGGTTWTQSTASCNLASATLILTTLHGHNPSNVPYVIAYEAYDTVAAPTMVNAAQATQLYFEPMLATFQFK